jgi:acyl-CoA synthetase
MLTRLSATDLQAFTAAGYWRDDTIYALVHRHADISPDKIAVRERARTTTYSALVDAADRLAASLFKRGVRSGHRVAVWLPSRAETAAAILACSRNGYVCSPSFHRDHTVGEMIELMQRMRAVALIAEKGYGADSDRHDVLDAACLVESLRFVVQLDPRDTGDDQQPLFADLPTLNGGPLPRADPNTIVYLAFTSGTTGQPKGVMHSDNTLLAPVRALAADWSLDEGMVIYSLSPLSHNLGFGAMLLALVGGGEIVVHDLPRGASVADRLHETRATFAFGVPTNAIDLLAELKKSPRDLRSLKGFRISGAPVPPIVAQGLLEHGIVLQSGYGMTEAGSHQYTLPADDPTLTMETSGRACAGYAVKIFDRDDPDKELPAGATGQIGGRGASLMLGYFDDQPATEQSFNASGWFMTGDLGWIDEAGYLRVTGRKKDLIIRGGHNIFPAKIENLAMRHEAIDKAAVIPVADDRLGERVCLAVTNGPGRTASAEELLAHLDASGLSKFEMPEYFLQLDQIPLMPSGKVSKRELLAWIATGRVTPTPIKFTRRELA